MKRISLLLSTVILATAFFSSCSSEKNVVIEKRHYGNGYYVHRSGSHTNTTTSVAVANPTPTTPEKVVVNSTPTQTTLSTADHSNTQLQAATSITTAATAKSNSTKKAAQQASAPKAKAVAVDQNVAATHNVAKTEKESAKNSGGGDVNAILLIILCIFLPPVAVFLSDGLSTNFWIDLILTLLFWIPGVIFAFIVCFA